MNGYKILTVPFGTIESRSVPKLEAVDRQKTSMRFLTYDILRANDERNSDTSCYSSLYHVKITTTKKYLQISSELTLYFYSQKFRRRNESH